MRVDRGRRRLLGRRLLGAGLLGRRLLGPFGPAPTSSWRGGAGVAAGPSAPRLLGGHVVLGLRTPWPGRRMATPGLLGRRAPRPPGPPSGRSPCPARRRTAAWPPSRRRPPCGRSAPAPPRGSCRGTSRARRRAPSESTSWRAISSSLSDSSTWSRSVSPGISSGRADLVGVDHGRQQQHAVLGSHRACQVAASSASRSGPPRSCPTPPWPGPAGRRACRRLLGAR